jgi:hypothetical protein
MAGKHFKILLISLGLATAVISNKLLALQLSSILFMPVYGLGTSRRVHQKIKTIL